MHNYNNDIELFDAFQDGRPEASDALFMAHFRPLCFYAERLTGSMPEAEDIVADSFVKMLQWRETFESAANIKAFLYTATKNACINHYKAGVRHENAHRQMKYLLKNESGQEPSFEEEMIRAEVVSEIYKEVEELPDRCREIFKMIFFEGLSTDQIAEKMGIAVQTVRTQKARAIQLLKTELLKKGKLTALIYVMSCIAAQH